MVDSNHRVLVGRYGVGELIGRGGMAEVRIGRDNRLSRRVAIKLLRADLAQDSTFQARFRREAQSAAALNHPAIVSVYDTGEDTETMPDGTERHVPFIVMEYVEGHTVRELLRDGAALPLDEAVEITEGVLSALEYSHHAGIIHRDIKPANVMITTTGDVKVMDFGIARAVADSAATMTQTQAVVGTAQYLSPEQARGEVVDARSDVYSTGALLFELLTGRPPFQGDSPVAVAYQHVREEPPTPSSIASDVPDELDRITLKALAKDRTLRYQSAAEFRADLEAAVRGGVVGAPAVGVIAAATQAMAPAAGPTQVLPTPPPGQNQTTDAIQSVATEDPDRRGKAWIWVLSILAALLLGAVAWAVFNNLNGGKAAVPSPSPSPSDTAPVAVTIPSVAGKTAAEARTELTALGLTVAFEVVPEASDEVEKDLVIRTDPAAGQSVVEGSEVALVVSTGPSAIEVPNVIGDVLAEARNTLTTAGFTLAQVTERPMDTLEQAEGRVVSIEPGVGTMAAPDQQFTIYVSTGQAPELTVPDVIGQTFEEARNTLAELGFTPANITQIQEPSPAQGAGRVYAIEPGVGSSVSSNTDFKISVASGKVPIPDLTGMTEQEATEALAAGALGIDVQHVDTYDWPTGSVMNWSPRGELVDQGTVITVEVANELPEPSAPGSPSQSPTNANVGDEDDG